jgi:FkbM family methyltransferase
MTTDAPRDRTGGIARSLRIYHRDTARIRRMDALNARICPAGARVFDIGAHVGDRVASFRRLGASVVAVEPQPAAMRALRLMFRADPAVTLLPVAVGAQRGTTRLYLNTRNPTVSTASQQFITAAGAAPGWRQEHWDSAIDVPMVTLDDLVAQHGLPDFVKIDVEGFEAEVLKGLSRPLPALSFEITTLQRPVAREALARLTELGAYVFNFSAGEAHALHFSDWVSAERIAAFLTHAPDDLNSGDVYARLT